MNRKKLSKFLLALSMLVIAFIPALTYVQAAGFHRFTQLDEYYVTTDTASMKCVLCDEYSTVKFIDCANSKKSDSNFNSGFDVVKDGVINAKDYANLHKTYKHPSQSTTLSTTKTSTSQKVTDKDGWDNEILKP